VSSGKVELVEILRKMILIREFDQLAIEFLSYPPRADELARAVRPAAPQRPSLSQRARRETAAARFARELAENPKQQKASRYMLTFRSPKAEELLAANGYAALVQADRSGSRPDQRNQGRRAAQRLPPGCSCSIVELEASDQPPWSPNACGEQPRRAHASQRSAPTRYSAAHPCSSEYPVTHSLRDGTSRHASRSNVAQNDHRQLRVRNPEDVGVKAW